MRKHLSLLIVGLFVLPCTAQAADLKPTKQVFGKVDDKELAKLAPKSGYVTNAKDFEKIWTAWGIKDKAPTVDFAKELVVVKTSDKVVIDSFLFPVTNGDLAIVSVGGFDAPKGFSYGIAVIKREGIKTVDGAPLQK